MAWAKKCDICGKFFTYDPDEDYIGIAERTMSGITVPREAFDACPECISAVKELIEKRGAENDKLSDKSGMV